MKLNAVKYMRPSAEFREVWQYNNHMLDIGASLIEHITNTSFPEFVTKNIFERAGLTSTTYNRTWAEQTGRAAEGFSRLGETLINDGKLVAFPLEFPKSGGANGAGGVSSTARDMATWLQVLLLDGNTPRAGRSPGKLVVPTLDKMQTGITVVSGRATFPEMAPNVYGMGLSISSYQGHEYIEHGGAINGFLSQVTRFQQDGLGIAVLTNDSPRGVFVHEAIKWKIAERLLRLPKTVDWNGRYRLLNWAVKVAQQLAKRSRRPPPRNAPLPSVHPRELAGSYHNPAYGTLDVSLIEANGGKIVLSTELTLANSVVECHLAHYSGDFFNVTATLKATPLGTREPVVRNEGYIESEFGVKKNVNGEIVVDGLALYGGIWGAGAGVPAPNGDTPREKAEVWFDRVPKRKESSFVVQV